VIRKSKSKKQQVLRLNTGNHMEKEFLISEHLLEKIREFADAGYTPFYIYDTKRIQENCREFLNIKYSPLSVNYAMMANSNPRFLDIIKQAGLKIFVNSLPHLEMALDLNFRGDEIIFAASAMDESAMRRVKSSGAKLILDSLGQFELWQSLFPETAIGIRCNIGELVVPRETTGGYSIGNQSRMGLTMDSVNRLKGNHGISGLHIYVGTNISEIDYFLDCYKHVTNLAGFFPRLEYIDFGGGFGSGERVIRGFNIPAYGRKVTELMENIVFSSGRKIGLILEPGRIIGADAGYFVSKITDIKMRNNQQLIGVNASSVQFPRPLFYPDSAYHPVSILSRFNSTSGITGRLSSIYGCSTYSRDYLARDVDLPLARIGDIVILGHAGSYCSSAYTSFLGFPKAEEYFI
jgi:diaminopimelate decarboxylase